MLDKNTIQPIAIENTQSPVFDLLYADPIFQWILERGPGMSLYLGAFNSEAAAEAAAGTLQEGHLFYNNVKGLFEIYYSSAWILYGSGGALTGEFCPGYTPVFVDTDTFKIADFNLSALFKAGRRIRLIDNGIDKYGVINTTTVNPSPLETVFDVTMENGATITAGLSDVCIVPDTTVWVPTSTLPLGGDSINAIESGYIGAEYYTLICGNNGKAAYSIDGGVTWTSITTGTTEHLNTICYHSVDQEFFIGGNTKTMLRSVDGQTVTPVSVPITPSGVATGDIYGMKYDTMNNAIYFNWRSADTVDTCSYTVNKFASVVTKPLTQYKPSRKSNAFNMLPIGSDDLHVQVSSGVLGYYTTIGDPSPTNEYAANTSQINAYSFRDSSFRMVTVRENGNLLVQENLTLYSLDDVTCTGPMLSVAYSQTLSRWVAVGSGGQIAYLDQADEGVNDAWTAVPNGFSVLDTINDIHWNPVFGVFIAVSQSGVVCRSSNGVN